MEMLVLYCKERTVMYFSLKTEKGGNSMDAQLKMWLDGEMKEFSGALKEFRRKVMRKVPLWMAISIGGMTALGFFVGYEPAYVFRVHFLIGLVIALFIWFCFWAQGRATSVKRARAIYEMGIKDFFQSEEEKQAFCRQMETGQCGKLFFYNFKSDSYPCRLVIGPDYWYFFRIRFHMIRVADIYGVSERTETSRVSVNTGGVRVKGNVSAGVSLVVNYKVDTPSAKKGIEECLLLENDAQCQEAMELIRKYCPASAAWKAWR